MLLVKWQQLTEKEKTDILNEGLKISKKDVRFNTQTLDNLKLYIGNKKVKENRKKNPDYFRTEIYLDDITKSQLEDIKHIRGVSFSEIVEQLIKDEYDINFK